MEFCQSDNIWTVIFVQLYVNEPTFLNINQQIIIDNAMV